MPGLEKVRGLLFLEFVVAEFNGIPINIKGGLKQSELADLDGGAVWTLKGVRSQVQGVRHA